MHRLKQNTLPKTNLNPLRLYNASSVQISNNINLGTSTPKVRLTSLNLHNARSIYLPGNRSSYPNVFNKRAKIVLSPLKSSVLRQYSIQARQTKRIEYPSVTQCNLKRCGT